MKYLIVGLGNPGPQYELTRHNIGFLVLDRLAEAIGAKFKLDRLGLVAEGSSEGRHYVLLKPSTYMNESGKAVRYWMQQEKISPDRIMVITDDVALPYGKLRMRAKGSAGGHNGLKSIEALIMTQDYPRLRFGVGSDFPKGRQADYVLSNFNKAEMTEIVIFIDKAVEATKAFAKLGIEQAMNTYNTN